MNEVVAKFSNSLLDVNSRHMYLCIYTCMFVFWTTYMSQ